MYYLLQFGKYGSKEIEETINFGLKNDVEIQRRFKDVIIKYSENVYDLIEVGDLVELKMLEDKPSIIHKYEEYDLTAMRDLKIVDRYCIAIYKQDNKGNYILVWRKENG